LIYLDNAPQEKVLHTFHYALKPGGYLFLGKSETIGSSSEFFEPLDRKIKMYLRKGTKSPQLAFTVDKAKRSTSHVNQFITQRAEINVEKVISKLILSQFVHPCVVINKGLSIIHFFGATSAYLQPITGRASLNVLKIIREDLVLDLGVLIQQAKKSMKPASKNIRMTDINTTKEITIDVVPTRVAEEMLLLVVFKENGTVAPIVGENGGSNTRKANNKTISRLEEELSQSRSLVRTTNEEYETTFEELQANSEEILSSNEELQSVNEELESSKEELQSAIEELTTTNSELSIRNSDLDKSQKLLKKVNEQLEQFAFISSHDLQEPLRKIQTFSNRLLDEKANLNEFARNYANKISASSARMATLIKDLLAFSLLNRSDSKPVPVDLNQILKDVLNDFETTIEEKKAVVNVQTLPIVQAEPIQINQLFHNLLSNSLKFSKADPEITILSRDSNKEDLLKYPELDRDKNYVAISVSDNGIGFDDRFIDRMFILFQRLHDKKDVAGTGVGLTVCKKIVEDHGGFIYGHGEEGRGATFTIFLPR
jgi:signal transduction histidine kinase